MWVSYVNGTPKISQIGSLIYGITRIHLTVTYSPQKIIYQQNDVDDDDVVVKDEDENEDEDGSGHDVALNLPITYYIKLDILK